MSDLKPASQKELAKVSAMDRARIAEIKADIQEREEWIDRRTHEPIDSGTDADTYLHVYQDGVIAMYDAIDALVREHDDLLGREPWGAEFEAAGVEEEGELGAPMTM